MSKIHTTVRVGVDGSLTLPAFFMRGMGYAVSYTHLTLPTKLEV